MPTTEPTEPTAPEPPRHTPPDRPRPRRSTPSDRAAGLVGAAAGLVILVVAGWMGHRAPVQAVFVPVPVRPWAVLAGLAGLCSRWTRPYAVGFLALVVGTAALGVSLMALLWYYVAFTA